MVAKGGQTLRSLQRPQELLSQDTAVPPPLARGAACVVAAKGFGAFGGVATLGVGALGEVQSRAVSLGFELFLRGFDLF